MVSEACAACAVVFAASIDPPVISPGGKPVTALPGLTPTLPAICDVPVLVTVVPARTAKGAALPNATAVVEADAGTASAGTNNNAADVATRAAPIGHG